MEPTKERSKFSAKKPFGRMVLRCSTVLGSIGRSKISPVLLHLKWAWGVKLGQKRVGARSKFTCLTNPQSTKVSKQL